MKNSFCKVNFFNIFKWFEKTDDKLAKQTIYVVYWKLKLYHLKNKEATLLNFPVAVRRTMAIISAAGGGEEKIQMDCNSVCTSHLGRLLRAVRSFASNLSELINYSVVLSYMLTLENRFQKLAVYHN